jgi:hypothetical protein
MGYFFKWNNLLNRTSAGRKKKIKVSIAELSYGKLTKALVIFSVVRLRSVGRVREGSLRFACAMAWQTERWNVRNSVRGLTPPRSKLAHNMNI